MKKRLFYALTAFLLFVAMLLVNAAFGFLNQPNDVAVLFGIGLLLLTAVLVPTAITYLLGRAK